MRDLPSLLNTLDPDATLVERHLWLMDLLQWVRGDSQSVPAALARVRLLLDALQAAPDKAARLRRWWLALRQGLDIAVLLAEFGFSSRSAFVSEFAERLRQKLLPATPETADAAELFSLVANHKFDAEWLLALDAVLLGRIVAALQSPADARAGDAAGIPDWTDTVLEAITICTSQVRAAGFASELRLRMSAQARQAAPFHALASDADLCRPPAAKPLGDQRQRPRALRCSSSARGWRPAGPLPPRCMRTWTNTACRSAWCFASARCANASCASAP